MGYFNAWYQVNAAVLWLETIVAIVVLLGILIFFWVRLRRLQNRYERLMGDSTGDRLEEMLEELAAFYDADVEVTSRRTLAMLEPALIVVMSCIVGFIVLSTLLPILRLSGSL